LQFVHTALKLRLAAFNLAFKIATGVVALLAITIPKYLNYATVSIFYPYTYNYAELLTNMALVLPTLISKLFYVQKSTSLFNNS
jgi:hypothetical protein